jgi:hypothetical protein
MHARTIVALTLVSYAAPRLARAEPTSKSACLAAYEQAQVQRHDGKLKAALEQLNVCARAECPEAVRADCVPWLGEVDKSVPSVVLEARTEHGDVTVARVLLDGVLLVDHLDGKAIDLDPGPHTFRFEVDGRDAIEEQVVLAEGQKNRVVLATWTPPVVTPPPPPPETHPVLPPPPPADEGPRERPVPVSVYVLGGMGVLGIGGFAAFAGAGLAQKSSLGTSCAPFCASGDLSSAKTLFALADASLLVGVASLAVGTVLFVNRPEKGAPRTSVWIEPRAGGGAAVLAHTF